MALMNGENSCGCIDHPPSLACPPYEPVVDPGATDDKRRNRVEETRGEYEVINRCCAPRSAVCASTFNKLLARQGPSKLDRARDLNISRSPDQEESLRGVTHGSDSRQKVVDQHDIGVHEAAK